MLADLARNDIGRVCVPGSVMCPHHVTERYSHVMHRRTVSGTLRDDQEALDAVTACFPAGTLSGAEGAGHGTGSRSMS